MVTSLLVTMARLSINISLKVIMLSLNKGILASLSRFNMMTTLTILTLMSISTLRTELLTSLVETDTLFLTNLDRG